MGMSTLTASGGAALLLIWGHRIARGAGEVWRFLVTPLGLGLPTCRGGGAVEVHGLDDFVAGLLSGLARDVEACVRDEAMRALDLRWRLLDYADLGSPMMEGRGPRCAGDSLCPVLRVRTGHVPAIPPPIAGDDRFIRQASTTTYLVLSSREPGGSGNDNSASIGSTAGRSPGGY